MGPTPRTGPCGHPPPRPQQRHLLHAPSEDSLPPDVGCFDFIVLSSVYEHLLPGERRLLLRQLWDALNPDGVLFIHGTPFRWYPFEFHTTALPFVNYMPDWLALRYARRFAGYKRRSVTRDSEWEPPLRGGIRGASEREILRLLNPGGRSESQPVLLKPTVGGYRDVIDIWYARRRTRMPRRMRAALRVAFKVLSHLTGQTFAPGRDDGYPQG